MSAALNTTVVEIAKTNDRVNSFEQQRAVTNRAYLSRFCSYTWIRVVVRERTRIVVVDVVIQICNFRVMCIVMLFVHLMLFCDEASAMQIEF